MMPEFKNMVHKIDVRRVLFAHGVLPSLPIIVLRPGGRRQWVSGLRLGSRVRVKRGVRGAKPPVAFFQFRAGRV